MTAIDPIQEPLVPPKKLKEGKDTWREVLTNLSNRSDIAGSNIDAFVVSLRCLGLAQMIKIRWDSSLKVKTKRCLIQHRNHQAILYDALLTLINEVHLVIGSGPYQHPALRFEVILREFEVETFFGYSEKPNKTSWKKQLQAENQALKNLKNPFTQPATKTFFDEALTLAQSCDKFRNRSYTPFRRAREKSTAFVAARGQLAQVPSMDGKLKPARQGRRKSKA